MERNAYSGLILDGCDHYRTYHSQNEFSRGTSHAHGIESFWGLPKRRFSKFNGFSSKSFVSHLKEREFRFSHRGEGLLPFSAKVWD
jgi:transposase-like protein